jgi:Fe-S-cluster containining protein
MVYPSEIRTLARQNGRSWEEVAQPYPEEIFLPSGQRCTFEWALRKDGERCVFLEDDRCQVYPCRPWICRTYPFVLADGRLLQEPCPGLGEEIGEEEALALARALLLRREAEAEEEARVLFHSRQLGRLKGGYLLIDGEGVKVLEP